MMVNVVGSKDDYSRWKPANMQNYLTVAELSVAVERSVDRIKRLERDGKLPKPIRVKVGRLKVRLYSPEHVKKIKTHFKNAKPGNPGRK